MRLSAGSVLNFADCHAALGCTTSEVLSQSETLSLLRFVMAPGTDISAEVYTYPKLWIVAHGSATVYGSSSAVMQPSAAVRQHATTQPDVSQVTTSTLDTLTAYLVPQNTPVGLRSSDGCVYSELAFAKETHMNEALKAGISVKLADLLPYEDGKIVNMDLAHNDGMKLALMSFSAGTGLSEHAAPGEALVFALEGEGVITYEGVEHTVHAGENFKFDRGGKHSVRADQNFKMALLITLE